MVLRSIQVVNLKAPQDPRIRGPLGLDTPAGVVGDTPAEPDEDRLTSRVCLTDPQRRK